MQALCYHGPKDIRIDTIDAPVGNKLSDVIVKVNSCAICGSDLHIYHGNTFSEDRGYCIGHEAVGEVMEVGSAVRNFKTGDQVMISAGAGCGQCKYCLAGRINECATGTVQCYGLGHSLPGCQAEAVRVPMADFNMATIPEGMSNDQALLLTDNLPTAYLGCQNAEISAGDDVVIIGCGPIGLMAVELALVMGASRVFAVDRVQDRLDRARGLGAIALPADEAALHIAEATAGRMANCAVECVGNDQAIRSAIRLVGPQGRVSVIGVNQNMKFEFPMALAFVKGLTFRISACPILPQWNDLIPLLQNNRIQPEQVISHRMTLAEGQRAYELFDSKQDGALKMVMTP